MNAEFDASFISRISAIEALFDLVADEASFAAFHPQWISFVNDLNHAVDANLLGPSTTSTAHALAIRVTKVVQTFLELENLSIHLVSSMVIEASSILDVSTFSHSSTTSDILSSTLRPRTYIEPSFQWLLTHLNNPYPSVRIRNVFAHDTGCARKDIDSWFTDVRKRIGWNSLRKTRFSNKRHDIVDAATRFFVEERPLDPNIELEFVAIETRAKALYSEKFSESDLAAKLDMMVKDMTPEMKVLAKEEERRRLLLQKDENIARRSRPISSYPSPDRSPNHSPEPDLPSLISHCDEAVPVLNGLTSGRKRQNSCSDLSDHSANQPNKRFRLDVSPSAFVGLPSPASSFHEDLLESELTVASTLSDVPAPNGKRRLSDANVQGAPKHPRNLVGPRLHGVSDPLPMSSSLLEALSFDGWFKENFELPNIASIDELDPSIPVEVKLCNASVFNDNALQLSSPISDAVSSPGYAVPSSLCPSPSLPLETHPLPLDLYPSESDFTDCFAQDDFTRLLQVQGLVDKHELSLPFDIPPLDPGFSLNSFHPYTIFPMPLPTQTIDTPVLPDLSTRVSAAPSDVDWSFSRFLSPPPLQDIVGSEHKLDNFFNVFHPEDFSFDLTMLDPTRPNSDVVDTTLADRAAKEKQLMVMKEAARKLEEELAAS